MSVNGIPASCQSKNCSFTFSEEMTPRVDSFFPMNGGGEPGAFASHANVVGVRARRSGRVTLRRLRLLDRLF